MHAYLLNNKSFDKSFEVNILYCLNTSFRIHVVYISCCVLFVLIVSSLCSKERIPLHYSTHNYKDRGIPNCCALARFSDTYISMEIR